MSLYLPKESDLKDKQKDVLNLPVTDNYLVVGGPGIGKTVMAIYRAMKAIEEEKTNVSDFTRNMKLLHSSTLYH